jgi:hypothetical protein
MTKALIMGRLSALLVKAGKAEAKDFMTVIIPLTIL